MRFPTLFLTSIFIPCLLAQQEVRITDAQALEDAREVRKVKGVQEALLAAGLSAQEYDVVREFGDRADRPPGLRTDSTSARNAPYVINYAGFRLCNLMADTQQLAVVMVPAESNLHMPEDMRPLGDFYVVLPERVLQNATPPNPRPRVSRGPQWKTRAKAKILKPDALYAAYDLASDSAALQALARTGMSQPEIDAVVFRSMERNWPDGIDSFEDRYPRLEQFKKYHAYLGARWGDKVLLIIPVQKNKRMPVTMRPYMDLYFVYSASGVKL